MIETIVFCSKIQKSICILLAKIDSTNNQNISKIIKELSPEKTIINASTNPDLIKAGFLEYFLDFGFDTDDFLIDIRSKNIFETAKNSRKLIKNFFKVKDIKKIFLLVSKRQSRPAFKIFQKRFNSKLIEQIVLEDNINPENSKETLKQGNEIPKTLNGEFKQEAEIFKTRNEELNQKKIFYSFKDLFNFQKFSGATTRN